MTTDQDKLNRALEKNELFLFLTGQNEYYFECPHANLPTHPHVAFNLLEKVFTNEINLKKFLDALLDLSKNERFGWFSIYYVMALLRHERDYGKLKIAVPYDSIAQNISRNKLSFSNIREWQGSIWPDGVWGDVRRMTKIINEDFGKDFLK